MMVRRLELQGCRAYKSFAARASKLTAGDNCDACHYHPERDSGIAAHVNKGGTNIQIAFESRQE